MTAAAIVKALGGRGNMARCPAHDDRTPSLSVSDGPDGKLLVKCHAGCSQADVWAALKRLGLVGNGEPVRHTGRREKTPAERQAEALTFSEESGPIQHTPGEEYLHCRGLTIEPPDCIRHHRRRNVLVAIVQARDGTFSGIQRIYLTTDSRGTWATRKMSLGPIKGGAVRLTLPATRITLCESVEDGLALLQLTGRPTWAVPGAGFMVSFEPPPEVRQVVLAPDHDKAGLEAIEATKKALATVKVRQLLPPEGQDWCDVLQTWDERAAIREFDGEQPREAAEQRSWVEAFVDGD